MADEGKAISAKDRLKAAKEAAEEADFSDAVKVADEAAGTLSEKKADSSEVDQEAEAAPDQATSGDKGDIAAKAETEAETDGAESAATDEADAVADEAGNDGESSDAETPEEPQETDQNDDERQVEEPAEVVDEDEQSSTPMSAVILKYLVILIVGAVLALWAAPRIAPSLPGWAAPIATFLTPGANQADEQFAELKAETEAQIESLTSRLSDVEANAGAEAITKAGAVENRLVSVEAALTEQIEAVAAEPRADLARMDDIAKRLAQAEAKVAGMATEVETLAGFSGENAAPSAATLERVAAFGAAVEGLRAEIEVLSAQAAEIEGKASGEAVAALIERVDALEEGEAATSGAREEADDIRRAAGIEAALVTIEQNLQAGGSFEGAIGTLERLAGAAAPAELTAVASGPPTAPSLESSFSAAAKEAYAAALVEDAGDDMGSQVFAKLQGRFGGRPAVETEGDDAGAVLSRIKARVEEGDLAAALTEAGGLSAGAQSAMQGWLDQLSAIVAAKSAFAEYRATIEAM